MNPLNLRQDGRLDTVIAVIAILVMGNFCLAVVDVLIKLLGKESSIFQYLLLRQIMTLAVVLPLLLARPCCLIRPKALKVYAFRALMMNIGAPCAAIAVMHLSLATANVVFYLAPLITVLLASCLVKEPLKWHRIVVILTGFAGAIVALRPGDFTAFIFFALATASALACSNLSAKWLPADATLLEVIFWSNLFALPVILLFALYDWQPITEALLLLSVGTCICTLIYQGCALLAFKHAEAGAVSAAEYSGLVFAVILGWLVFNESLTTGVIIGLLLIILPMLWQTWYEHQASVRDRSSPQ